MRTRLAIFMIAVAWPACRAQRLGAQADAALGLTDAGSPDAARTWDAGRDQGPGDAGFLADAAPVPDAGEPDATAAPDSGRRDAGGPDDGGGAACTPVELYLSPTGDDSQAGAPGAPLRTLEGAEARVRVLRPACDVWVRIAPGSYDGDPVLGPKPHAYWSYSLPVPHRFYFVPSDYGTPANPDPRTYAGTRPIFEGMWNGTPNPNVWFSSHTSTPMVFRYLKVQNFMAVGLQFQQSDGNDVWGMYFYQIGNRQVPDAQYGWSGMTLNVSSNNQIVNNHFINLEDAPGVEEQYIHGIYLIHGSNNNTIKSNEFRRVSGGAIKLRDGCVGNTIADNTFTDTSLDRQGVYMDHFCWPGHDSTGCVPSCNPLTFPDGGCTTECPSWDNDFTGNGVYCAYNGNSVAAIFLAYDGGVPDECVPLGAVRVSASNNTVQCPPP